MYAYMLSILLIANVFYTIRYLIFFIINTIQPIDPCRMMSAVFAELLYC